MGLSTKMIVVGFVGIVAGIFLVQEDLRLTYLGRTADAEVMDEYLKPDRILRDGYLSVEYRFKDETGTLVTGGGRLPTSYLNDIPVDKKTPGTRHLTMKVLYMHGNSKVNKMEAEPSSGRYKILYLGLLLFVVGMALAKYESGQAVRKRVADQREREQNRPVIAEERRERTNPETLEL